MSGPQELGGLFLPAIHQGQSQVWQKHITIQASGRKHTNKFVNTFPLTPRIDYKLKCPLLQISSLFASQFTLRWEPKTSVICLWIFYIWCQTRSYTEKSEQRVELFNFFPGAFFVTFSDFFSFLPPIKKHLLRGQSLGLWLETSLHSLASLVLSIAFHSASLLLYRLSVVPLWMTGLASQVASPQDSTS